MPGLNPSGLEHLSTFMKNVSSLNSWIKNDLNRRILSYKEIEDMTASTTLPWSPK